MQRVAPVVTTSSVGRLVTLVPPPWTKRNSWVRCRTWTRGAPNTVLAFEATPPAATAAPTAVRRNFSRDSVVAIVDCSPVLVKYPLQPVPLGTPSYKVGYRISSGTPVVRGLPQDIDCGVLPSSEAVGWRAVRGAQLERT